MAVSLPAMAEIYDEAVALFNENDPQGARPLFEQAYQEGNKEAALYLGRIAFMDYDFPAASQWYATFRKETGISDASHVADSERQLKSAQRLLERVQKIVILDSITVNRDELLDHYRLPKSAGRLLTPEEIAATIGMEFDGLGPGYSNEFGDLMIWSMTDSVGNQRIMESSRLIDGSWSDPLWASAVLNGSEVTDEYEELTAYNALYPFLLDDGQTLYYASDNQESIGGLDIFLATRSSSTGDYLKPSNMGMPFNSPDDDYMLAIDQLNGIGWWATDRNHLGDLTTIYVYVLPDARENIPEDADPVVSARIDDFHEWWTDENADKIAELKALIEEMDPDPFRTADFTLPVPVGGYYSYWSDFKNSRASDAMKSYLDFAGELNTKEQELRQLRKAWSEGRKDDRTRGKIVQLENEVEKLRGKVKNQLSEVYKLEFSIK